MEFLRSVEAGIEKAKELVQNTVGDDLDSLLKESKITIIVKKNKFN